MRVDSNSSALLRHGGLQIILWMLACSVDTTLAYTLAGIGSISLIAGLWNEIKAGITDPSVWYVRYMELMNDMKFQMIRSIETSKDLHTTAHKLEDIMKESTQLKSALIGYQVRAICDNLEIPEFLLKYDDTGLNIEIGDDETKVYVDMSLIGLKGLEGAIEAAREKWQNEKNGY